MVTDMTHKTSYGKFSGGKLDGQRWGLQNYGYAPESICIWGQTYVRGSRIGTTSYWNYQLEM